MSGTRKVGIKILPVISQEESRSRGMGLECDLMRPITELYCDNSWSAMFKLASTTTTTSSDEARENKENENMRCVASSRVSE